MKAHIAAAPRCALAWNLKDAPALEKTARAFRLTLRHVGEGDLAATVGDLCAGRPAPACAPLVLAPPRPALIVSGLRHDTGELDAFLTAVKNAGTAVPLRAMVTPTSKDWTLLQLLQELNAEHDAVEAPDAP